MLGQIPLVLMRVILGIYHFWRNQVRLSKKIETVSGIQSILNSKWCMKNEEFQLKVL